MNGLWALLGGTIGMIVLQVTMISGHRALFPPEPPERVYFSTTEDYRRELERRVKAESELTRERTENAELATDNVILREQLRRVHAGAGGPGWPIGTEDVRPEDMIPPQSLPTQEVNR